MNYQNFVVFNPKIEQVAPDILVVEFWKPEFCEHIIKAADSIDRYESRPGDPVPGQELRIDQISPDFYKSFCIHWKHIIQPILDKFYLLDAKEYFIGWKKPFIIKYEMNKQRELRPHADDSLITGTVRLNDRYTGGDLVFPRQNYTNEKVPVGSIVLWPSSIPHIHYSSELKSGTKYSLVAWTKNYPQQEGINYDEV